MFTKKLFSVILPIFCISLSSCDVHIHEFEDKWSFNETSHWHKSTCGHDVLEKEGNHSFSEWIIKTAPSCDTEGLKERSCNVCDYKETEIIAATGHSFNSNQWSSDEDSHWHQSTCGHDLKRDEGTHIFSEWKTSVPATCLTNGEKERTCIVCDYKQTETIIASGHKFSNTWSFDETNHWHAATCEHESEKSMVQNHDFDSNGKCKICDFVKSVSVSHTVTEDVWKENMNGYEPFLTIKNGTIVYKEKFNNEVCDSRIVEVDGNLMRDTNDTKFPGLTLFFEYDDEETYVYKNSLENVDKFSKEIKRNRYFDLFHLDLFYFDDFTYNELTESYEATELSGKLGDFCVFASIKFENNKIVNVDFEESDGIDSYSTIIDYSYEPVTINLPTDFISYSKLSLMVPFSVRFTDAFRKPIDEIQEKHSDDKNVFTIETFIAGSNLSLRSRLLSDFATGHYTDLFVGYNGLVGELDKYDGIQNLDNYVSKYNSDFNCSILDDYIPQFLDSSFSFRKSDSGNFELSSLPFMTNTEVMHYNGVFVDYCKTIDADLGSVPCTWQEWCIKGSQYREILDSLTKPNEDTPGFCVYGNQNYEGKAYDFSVKLKVNKQDEDGNYIDEEGRKLLLDFTDVSRKNSSIISWEDQASMFITLIKQWGIEYTNMPESEFDVEPLHRKINVLFGSQENRGKLIELLRFFNKLYEERIFTIPGLINESFNDRLMGSNRIMFSISTQNSMKTLSENVIWKNRIRSHPIPYYSDGVKSNKFLYDFDTKIAMTDYTKKNYKGFETMIELTTGSKQAELAINLGFTPTTVSAINSQIYQEFLNENSAANIEKYMNENSCTMEQANEHAYSKPSKVLSRESSNTFINEYLGQSNGWELFSTIPTETQSFVNSEVERLFRHVFITLTSTSDDASYSEIIEGTLDDIKRYYDIRIIE